MDKKKIFTIVIIAGAIFMEMVDTTIINTALPVIAKDFNTTPLNVKMAITSYLVSLALFIPTSAFLADKFGIKKIFGASLVLFTLSSFFAGFAQNTFQLTSVRVVQGFAGALMTPLARLILVRMFSGPELVKATTYVFVPALLGPMLGPTLGGIITTYISWHYIFFVNIPIGIILFVLCLKFIDEEKSHLVGPFDVIGFILSACALPLTALGMETLSDSFFDPQIEKLLQIIGPSFFLVFIIYCIFKKQNCIFNFSVFKKPTYSLGILGNSLAAFGSGAVNFTLPLLFQFQFSMTPAQSGVSLTPIAGGAILGRFVVSQLIEKFGFHFVTAVGSFTSFTCMLLLSFLSMSHGYSVIYLILGFFGIGTVFIFASCGPFSYTDINRSESGNASTIDSTLRQFILSLSVGLSAWLLSIFLKSLDVGFSDPKALNAFHDLYKVFSLFFLVQFGISLYVKFILKYDKKPI